MRRSGVVPPHLPSSTQPLSFSFPPPPPPPTPPPPPPPPPRHMAISLFLWRIRSKGFFSSFPPLWPVEGCPQRFCIRGGFARPVFEASPLRRPLFRLFLPQRGRPSPFFFPPLFSLLGEKAHPSPGFILPLSKFDQRE